MFGLTSHAPCLQFSPWVKGLLTMGVSSLPMGSNYFSNMFLVFSLPITKNTYKHICVCKEQVRVGASAMKFSASRCPHDVYKM